MDKKNLPAFESYKEMGFTHENPFTVIPVYLNQPAMMRSLREMVADDIAPLFDGDINYVDIDGLENDESELLFEIVIKLSIDIEGPELTRDQERGLEEALEKFIDTQFDTAKELWRVQKEVLIEYLGDDENEIQMSITLLPVGRDNRFKFRSTL